MSDPDWPYHCGDGWRAHVLTVAGYDIVNITGPSPRRPREWVAMMRRLGVRSMSGVVSSVHGPPLTCPKLASRGDIVRRGWALGICRGEQAEFFGGEMIHMRAIDEAWSVLGSIHN